MHCFLCLVHTHFCAQMPGTGDLLAIFSLSESKKNPDTAAKSQSVHPLARPPIHLALPKTNPWHRDPLEQVLYIFQLYNEAVDSFN